jgi:hypothetical protein
MGEKREGEKEAGGRKKGDEKKGKKDLKRDCSAFKRKEKRKGRGGRKLLRGGREKGK